MLKIILVSFCYQLNINSRTLSAKHTVPELVLLEDIQEDWCLLDLQYSVPAHTYLQYGLLVGSDQFRCVGNEVTQEFGTLLLHPPNATVLQLGEDLDQDLSQSGHHKGWVQVAQTTNDTHGKLTDTEHLEHRIVHGRMRYQCL